MIFFPPPWTSSLRHLGLEIDDVGTGTPGQRRGGVRMKKLLLGDRLGCSVELFRHEVLKSDEERLHECAPGGIVCPGLLVVPLEVADFYQESVGRRHNKRNGIKYCTRTADKTQTGTTCQPPIVI